MFVLKLLNLSFHDPKWLDVLQIRINVDMSLSTRKMNYENLQVS